MRLITSCAAILAATVSTCGAAEPGAWFAKTPLPDVALARVRGTSSPFAPLTSGDLLKLVDVQTHADLRQTGLVGRVQMDVWWGTIGSQLIANSVRASPGGS